MKYKIQVVDVDYLIENDEVTVRVFGKTDGGENFLGLVNDFRPYFYAVTPDPEKLQEKAQELDFEDDEGEALPVKETAIEQKTVGQEEREVLKVYTTIPPNVPKLKNEFWDLDLVEECREFDIPFYKRFLIDNDIRPGQWISVEGDEMDGEIQNTVEVDSVETDLEMEDEPGFSTMAFDLEVIDDEIVMCSFYGKGYEKVLTTRDIDRDYIEVVDDEEALVERFVEIVTEEDVDILTGYNTDEFDFSVLRERAEEYNLTLSLGRDGERMKFNRRGRFSSARLKGRMHLDLYPFVAHILSSALESETLDLDSVASELLDMNKDEMSWEEMKRSWRESEDLETFADYALKDSEIAYKLAGELVPQIMELSRITGMIPFDACRLTFGQLTENFLLREAYDKNMIAPNRPSQDTRSTRRRQGAYSGGFVYTPDAGLYDDIVLLDFRSLYPTVMVAHNISPDTLNLDDCDDRYNIEELGYDFCQDEQGFFPELVERLVSDRSKIKQKMAELDEDSQKYQSLYSRQSAEKILANSFYGYLGYEGARWYSRESAEATTYLGRMHIQNAIETAEERGYDVVYGDSLDYSRQIVLKDNNGEIVFREIGEFVEEEESPHNYQTLAFDEDLENVEFKPVKRAIAHEYDGEVLRFDTTRGRTKVTPQHSVYRYNDGEIELADAEELSKGDKLISLSNPPTPKPKYSETDVIDLANLNLSDETKAYLDKKRFSQGEVGKCPYCGKELDLASHVHYQHSDRKTDLENATEEHQYIGGDNAKTGRIPRYWDISEELAWVLGFYAGDGSASIGEKQMLSFGGQEEQNIRRVKRYFDEVLEDNLSLIEDIDKRTGNKMYYYRVQRKPLVDFFINGLEVGKGSEGKKVPTIILNGSENLKNAFLEGYTQADGSVDREVDDRYHSGNVRFSTKSPTLANQVQLLIKQLEGEKNRYGREISDVSYKYRADKPEIKTIRSTAPRGKEFEDKAYTPAVIKNIEVERPTTGKVYDLEVDGHHNFVDAEGLLMVHNTDSLFLMKDGIRKGIDDFLEEVNSELPEFMELEFEGFFKRGFFTSTESGEGAKKKYALMDEEGNLKITGFEQVRRDWSPIAKETQKEVLRKVLEKKPEEAAQIVKDTVKRLKDGEVPVDKLRIYTQLKKKPENYESTAPHVEAAKKAIRRGDDISPGSNIAYVITKGGGTISSRAELVKYAENYDASYYIDNQLVPATMRVLKVFDYTSDQLKGKGKQSGLGRFGT